VPTEKSNRQNADRRIGCGGRGRPATSFPRVDLGTVANVATAAAVIIGLVFGMFEVVRARREREERAAFEVVHAMLTPEWIRSAVLVLSAPDAMAVEDLQANPKLFEAAQSVAIILETLGYSVYKRLVPLPVVDELMGGLCASPGASCSATSSMSARTAARRRPGNGSSGSPSVSTNTAAAGPT